MKESTSVKIHCPHLKYKHEYMYYQMIDHVIRDTIPYPIRKESGENYFPCTYWFDTKIDALKAKEALGELDLYEAVIEIY